MKLDSRGGMDEHRRKNWEKRGENWKKKLGKLQSEGLLREEKNTQREEHEYMQKIFKKKPTEDERDEHMQL